MVPSMCAIVLLVAAQGLHGARTPSKASRGSASQASEEAGNKVGAYVSVQETSEQGLTQSADGETAAEQFVVGAARDVAAWPWTRAPPPVFPCDFECVKEEAVRQGADVLTSLENMKFSMDVTYSAAADAGEACGANYSYPAFEGVSLNPKAQLKLTTVHTREEPRVSFECEGGKTYHLVLNDCLGGAFQSVNAYNHWVKLNIACPEGRTWTRAEDSGENMVQTTNPAIPGWFDSTGYLPPAFPYNTFHHFNFYIFETATPFDDARLTQFNTDLPANNVLGDPANPAWTIADIMADLELAAPVARTWMDVTTSYWSQVRMGRVEQFVGNMEFYQIICPCNQASSWPGLFQSGDAACNL